MNKTRSILLVAAIAAALLYWLMRPGEEAQIRAVLEEVRSLAEVKEKLHPLEAAQRAKDVASHCTEQVTFRIELEDLKALRIIGQAELQQRVLYAQTQMKSLELQLQDLNIDIAGESASVEATASALGSLPGVEGQFFELHRVRLRMQKVDGNWKLAEAEHIQNLRQTE